MGGGTQIKVMVRVRPSLDREVVDGKVVCCVGVEPKAGKVYIGERNGVPVVINSEGKGSSEITEFTFDKALRGDCTEDEVYDSPVKDAVLSFLDGYNSTVFAYGQSGSGKTYTITNLTHRVLDTILEAEPEPSISVFQIYKEKLTDLLSPTVQALKIASTEGGGVNVESSTSIPFTSTKQACKLIHEAGTRRVTGSTNLNEVSSRSHLIMQISLPDGTKLSLVDLAGSERIKTSGATGERLEEAKKISSSLFYLIEVVGNLNNRSVHIPYRNSTLTYLLKESLGGDCKTVVIGTVSPAQEAAFESRCTLKFATACGKIENKPKKIVRAEKKSPKRKEAPKIIPWLNDKVGTRRETVETKYGKINIMVPEGGAAGDVVFLLHGCPSSATEYTHWFPAMVYCGLWPVAIDQPGFGYSEGSPRKSRSEFNNDLGGPVDVTMAVMRAMKVDMAHFVGYDWGAGIALSIGLRHPYKVKSIISMLPSYAEVKKGELSGLKPRTLIAWLTDDQFHNWKKWQPLAKSIPNGTIWAEKLGQRRRYEALSVPVVTFLTGKNPFATASKIAEAPRTEGVTTKGDKVTVVNNVVLAEDFNEEDQPTDSDDQKAVAAFLSWMASSDTVQAFKDAATSNSKVAQFAKLPKLTPETVQDGVSLVNLGLWTQPPKNMDILDSAPRYFKGRSILVRLQGLETRYRNPDYMKVVGKGGEAFVSHHGVITDTCQGESTYAVDIAGVVVHVPKKEVHELNQPHVFCTGGGCGTREYYLFEDGMRGSYDSALVAAKVAEIAFKLTDLVEKLDFAAKNAVDVQMKCVKLIRECLNTTTFATGVDRSRVGRTDDLGKIAGYGQVQCHGGSSVLAFFLLPFTKALGIDVKYRGGFTFGPGHSPPTAQVVNAPETHQWLELTFLPSCHTVVADVFLNMINTPAHDAYTDMMYPNGQLIIKSTSSPVVPSDVDHS